MAGEKIDRDVTLSSGGKNVPLNDFTKEIMLNVVAALVGTLKKGDANEEIVIRIGATKK
jgi:hypothetical protein